MTPHALLIDRQNWVVVADRENNRVQRFDRDGRFLDEIEASADRWMCSSATTAYCW